MLGGCSKAASQQGVPNIPLRLFVLRLRARPVCMPTLILGLAAAEQRMHSRQSHVDALLLLTMPCEGAVPLTALPLLPCFAGGNVFASCAIEI